jgi:hypothetical protein
MPDTSGAGADPGRTSQTRAAEPARGRCVSRTIGDQDGASSSPDLRRNWCPTERKKVRTNDLVWRIRGRARNAVLSDKGSPRIMVIDRRIIGDLISYQKDGKGRAVTAD